MVYISIILLSLILKIKYYTTDLFEKIRKMGELEAKVWGDLKTALLDYIPYALTSMSEIRSYNQRNRFRKASIKEILVQVSYSWGCYSTDARSQQTERILFLKRTNKKEFLSNALHYCRCHYHWLKIFCHQCNMLLSWSRISELSLSLTENILQSLFALCYSTVEYLSIAKSIIIKIFFHWLHCTTLLVEALSIVKIY